MPDIKNKLTGEIVESYPYTPQGEATAIAEAAANPNLEVDYSPGGEYNAMARNEMRTGYAKGGKVNKYYGGGMVKPIMPMYGHGGKVKK